MSIIHSARCGASLLVLLSTPAFAESASDDQDGRSIIVTAASAERIDRTAGGVDLVDASDFEDHVAVSLRDTLAFSPGVYAQPRFGQEVRLSIRGSGISRGYHMRGLMLFQDGMPINLADNNGDFQELDPQVFQQVEVYRGGNALRLGGSTLGGAINAVTPTGRSNPGYELRVDGGSFGTVRGKAAMGFVSGPGDAYLALTTDRSDGDRDHAKRNSIRFNGNVGLALGERAETRFYASVNHINQDLPGALTRTLALKSPRLSLPANITSDQERDIDSIRLQNRTTLDLGSVALSGGAFLNVKQLFHPIYEVIDQKSTDYGVFARADVVKGPVEASFGTTARFGRIAAKQFANVAGDRGAQRLDAVQLARTIDSYGEIRIRPVEPLSLIAGAVYTSGRREVINRTNPARSGVADFDRFAPRVGVLFEPSAGLQFFANYSRSVELPGLAELNQTPVSGITGFVDLDPQRAWTIEAGTRGQLGIARWDITVYRADIKGEMLQFAVGDAFPTIPAATFNADRTRHQGIEAGLDLQLRPWALLRQVYQLNDFRFRDDLQFDDNRLPVVAKQLYRAELRLGTDRFSVSPNVEWVPDGAWADYRNTTRAPGYALLGFGAEATVRQGVTLFLDARNLTGKKAIGDISAAVQATDASAIYYPAERRAFYGGVRARF